MRYLYYLTVITLLISVLSESSASPSDPTSNTTQQHTTLFLSWNFIVILLLVLTSGIAAYSCAGSKKKKKKEEDVENPSHEMKTLPAKEEVHSEPEPKPKPDPSPATLEPPKPQEEPVKGPIKQPTPPPKQEELLEKEEIKAVKQATPPEVKKQEPTPEPTQQHDLNNNNIEIPEDRFADHQNADEEEEYNYNYYVRNRATTDTTWEIRQPDIRITGEVEKNSFGTVYKGTWKDHPCLVRELKLKTKQKNSIISLLKEMKETKLMGPHRNIVAVLGACTNPEYPICLVTEFVDGKTMKALIYEEKIDLDNSILLRFAKDITCGMGFLHNFNILHGALEINNLIVEKFNDKYIVKITDFGYGRVRLGSSLYTTKIDNLYNMRSTAPEVITELKLTKAADVYSFGCVMWEIMEKRPPWGEKSTQKVLDNILGGKILPKPKKYADEFYNFMKMCWNLQPRLRPSFDFLNRSFGDLDIKWSGGIRNRSSTRSSRIIIDLNFDDLMAEEEELAQQQQQ
mmetsp:Transcript_22646/g.31526  ORF Transcript_22646/g.31526 Transcript_22646/m.31526 type:complete len:513 (-) Transcript_22646:7-1545(-)